MGLLICRKYMAEYKKVPSTTELQGFAKNIGKTVAFSKASPAITDFTLLLLTAFNGVTVQATDTREEKFTGALRSTTTQNKRWAIEVHPDAAAKYSFTTDKLPDVAVSDRVADWVRPEA